jgi:hypothetical protein
MQVPNVDLSKDDASAAAQVYAAASEVGFFYGAAAMVFTVTGTTLSDSV